MRKPKKDSTRDIVCRSIFRHGPMNMEQIKSHLPAYRADVISTAVHQIRHYGALELVKNIYYLANYMQEHYSGAPKKKVEPEVIAPVQAFKPWTGKYDTANGLRREEIRRDISFKTGSVGFQPFGYAL